MAKVFVGHDWAEAHHDVHVEDEQGRRLGEGSAAGGRRGRAPGSMSSSPSIVDEPGDVTIATETDRGLFVGALVAAGYRVLAVNPMSTSRYRERHSTSGAKSDPGDALVLAELARTDGHNHRPVAGDSDLAEAVKVARSGASVDDLDAGNARLNQLRSTLREFYPAALERVRSNSASMTRWPCSRSRRHRPWAGLVTVEDRVRVAARWPPTTHRGTRDRDPDRVASRAARGAAAGRERDGRDGRRAGRGRSPS